MPTLLDTAEFVAAKDALQKAVQVLEEARKSRLTFMRECLLQARARVLSMIADARIKAALDVAVRYGGTDGDHHKAWVIDQMVRALTGCPTIQKTAVDSSGKPYAYDAMGESGEYRELVREAKAGDDGPDTYDWDVGIAP